MSNAGFDMIGAIESFGIKDSPMYQVAQSLRLGEPKMNSPELKLIRDMIGMEVIGLVEQIAKDLGDKNYSVASVRGAVVDIASKQASAKQESKPAPKTEKDAKGYAKTLSPDDITYDDVYTGGEVLIGTGKKGSLDVDFILKYIPPERTGWAGTFNAVMRFKNGSDIIVDTVSASRRDADNSIPSLLKDFANSAATGSISGATFTPSHPKAKAALDTAKKQIEERVKSEKESRKRQDEEAGIKAAWEQYRKDAVAALPKPKKNQDFTDGETDYIAEFYGDNYVLAKNPDTKKFTIFDRQSKFVYLHDLKANTAKEFLGLVWQERGDTPLMKDGKPSAPSDRLINAADRIRNSRNNDLSFLPGAYEDEVKARYQASLESKSQALQSNLFGGFDEIPKYEKEADINAQSDAESQKSYAALERFRPSVRPKGEKLTDKQMQARIDEYNDYLDSVLKADTARKDFYTDEGDSLGWRHQKNSNIWKMFYDLDQLEEDGRSGSILVRDLSGKYGAVDIPLDPKNEQSILDFLRDKAGVKIKKGDTLASVRRRFRNMQDTVDAEKGPPKWMENQIGSVDSGRENAGAGIGLTPTAKAFVADQLFKLNAFDFPGAKEYASAVPKITFRMPGGDNQYQIPKTKEAVAGLLDSIGMKPKKGETVMDALKRNAEGLKDMNFSERRISRADFLIIQKGTLAGTRASISAAKAQSFSERRQDRPAPTQGQSMYRRRPDPRIERMKQRLAQFRASHTVATPKS